MQPIQGPRRIEYQRHIHEPEHYLPRETEFIHRPGMGGRLWARLGVDHVGMPELRRLADNRHPLTGGNLTARLHARSFAQSRTSYLSIVFNVSKSVSIMSELAGDSRLRDALLHTADESLQNCEDLLAGFRVRKASAPDRNRSRRTQQLAWIRRLENDSRWGDPNLHGHAEVFNATYDASDSRRPFKALDLHPFLKAQRDLSRDFDRRLELAVRRLGYETVPTHEASFEIAGVAPELISRFSKGRRAIRTLASTMADEKPAGKAADDPRAILRRASRRSRPRKVLWTQAQLRAHWRRQLTPREALTLVRLRQEAELREAAQSAGREWVPPVAEAPVCAASSRPEGPISTETEEDNSVSQW